MRIPTSWSGSNDLMFLELQWGPDFSSGKTRRDPDQRHRGGSPASMGPRLSSGKTKDIKTSRGFRWHFNGARLVVGEDTFVEHHGLFETV